MQTQAQNRAKVFLIISSIVYGILCIPALFMALFSAMIYDSPQAAESIITNVMVISLVTFPLVVMASIIVAWILYAKKHKLSAMWVGSLPALNILLFLGAIIIIMTECGGAFDCL